MNIAAWLAMAVTSSRSFCWNCASDSESSQSTPRTSFVVQERHDDGAS